MTVDNQGFEEAGALKGVAASWSSAVVSTDEDFAEFALDPSDVDTCPQETFDAGWVAPDDQVFVPYFLGFTLDIEAALFDAPGVTQGYEDFDSGWVSQVPAEAAALPGVQFAAGVSGISFASFDGEQVEDFEESWGATTIGFGAGDLESAVFNPAPRDELFDAFEDDWGNSAGIVYGLGAVQNALFYEREALPPFTVTDVAYENFERAQLDAEVSLVDTVQHLLYLVGPLLHVILVDDRVSVVNDDGEPPTPLQVGPRYYVSASSLIGGNPAIKLKPGKFSVDSIEFEDEGVDKTYIRFDPDRFWNRLMVTITL